MSENPVYLKVRKVRSRYTGYPPTYEATLRRFRGFNSGGRWDVIGKTKGHPDAETAQGFALKLADRRGIKLANDPREGKDAAKSVRQAEYAATYHTPQVFADIEEHKESNDVAHVVNSMEEYSRQREHEYVMVPYNVFAHWVRILERDLPCRGS